jgi:hypothetical protein
MTNVGGCFLDEDGKESVYGLLYVDLLTCIEKLLDEFEDIFDEESFSGAEEVQDSVTVSVDDIGDVLRVVFIDFSEFGDTVEAKAPAVSLDVGFNKIAGVVEVLNGLKVFEADFFYSLNLRLFVVVHGI